jgi:hypothetical protein
VLRPLATTVAMGTLVPCKAFAFCADSTLMDMPVSIFVCSSHSARRREKRGYSPDGRRRDKGILGEEGAGGADNRDVALSRADVLTPLVDRNHTGTAAGVYRHARALQVKKVRYTVSNHGSASACKKGMGKNLCIFGLDLVVIFVEGTRVHRSIGASKSFDGDTGCA